MKTVTALFILFVSTLVVGCSNNSQEGGSSGDVFTCPMHPTVRSSSPGSCPVCNMSLVRMEVVSEKDKSKQGNFVTLTPRQQVLAGIELDTVKKRSFSSSEPFLGRVEVDQRSRGEIRSRAEGRIEKLFVKARGTQIAKGDAICTLYSEKLLSDSKSYLALLKRNDSMQGGMSLIQDLVTAARQNLIEDGMSENEISAMEMRGTAAGTTTVFADRSGYVEEVSVAEGRYVGKGELLLAVVDLRQVWVDVQVYPYQNQTILGSNSFDIDPGVADGSRLIGTLVNENPAFVDTRKYLLLRLSVGNPNGILVPGMMVRVRPQSSPSMVLAIPESALLLDQMKSVWILAHPNTFEQRMISTGKANGGWVEVTNGLREGELVVSEGAYLINSEFILKHGTAQRHNH